MRQFSAAELEQVFDVQGLQRTSRSWSLNSGRFAQFNWLVVNDVVQHDDMGPDGRTLPGLFANLGQDFGRIEPYRTGLPAAVEVALFGLLTIPWEEIAGYREMEWRGFGVPWVYTIDTDIFAHRLPPPSPDSLSWEPAWYSDEDGEHEYERPITYPLDPDCDQVIEWLNDSAWDDIVSAQQTTFFQRPVAHFFIRGFQADGIDEFLAHISTIEAALGAPIDHDARKRPWIGGRNPGATFRVCLRISGLLNDATAGASYSKLFGLRSDFLHGKSMRDIPGVERRSARALARKVVCALIGAAVSSQTVDREQFLASVMNAGVQLDQQLNCASQSNGGANGR